MIYALAMILFLALFALGLALDRWESDTAGFLFLLALAVLVLTCGGVLWEWLL